MENKHTGLLLKQVYFLNQSRLNEMFAKFDLTASQTFTLIHLLHAQEEGRVINQRDIENELDISNPTVTGILNRLETKGLIQRKTSKEDARMKHILVTQKALELDKILRKEFAKNEQALVSCLSSEEASQLNEMLQRILISLSE